MRFRFHACASNFRRFGLGQVIIWNNYTLYYVWCKYTYYYMPADQTKQSIFLFIPMHRYVYTTIMIQTPQAYSHIWGGTMYSFEQQVIIQLSYFREREASTPEKSSSSIKLRHYSVIGCDGPICMRFIRHLTKSFLTQMIWFYIMGK